MRKLVVESYSQFLLEKYVDVLATLLSAFKEAKIPAEVDVNIKPEIDNKNLDANIELIIQLKNGDNFVTISIISGVVYYVDFKKTINIGDITDQKSLVNGIKKVFK